MSFQNQSGAMLYPVAFGLRPENVEVPHYDTRNPSPADTNYPVGKEWIFVGNSIWKLLSLSTVNNITTANWVLVTGNTGSLVSLKRIGTEVGGIIADANGTATLLGQTTTNQLTSADKVLTQNADGNAAIDQISGFVSMNPATTSAVSDTVEDKLENAGTASFDDTQFTVSPEGFVSLLNAGGTTYPGLVNNLAFNKTVNTVTFTGFDGTPLSIDNPANVWIQHPTLKSQLVEISFTNPWQVIDAGGAGNLNGNSFGTSSGAWATDMPWYVYLVVNDAATAGAIAFSRVPHLTVAPAVGLCATRLSAVASTQGSMYFLDEVITAVPTAPTVATFDSNPCVCVGSFRVQKASVHNWVVQTPNNSDGIGLYHENTAFTYPTNQNGAVAVTNANTHFVETAGFPGFSGQNYFYTMSRNGYVETANVNGGITTNGVNATNVVYTFPLSNLNQSNEIMGDFGTTTVPFRWFAPQRNGGSLTATFKFEGASAFMVNSDISAGGAAPDAAYQFNITAHYIAAIA